jgi:hypothetical protein
VIVSTVDSELVLKSASLSRIAPREWEEFLKAFRAYGDDQSRLCVQAATDQLHRMQGRAQQCDSLSDLFGNAGKTADRIAQKRAASAAVQQRR